MMRVLMLDPSLFTLPYDRALCGGLAAQGCAVTLAGRPLRPLEPPADADGLPLLPHFYGWTEAHPGLPRTLARLTKPIEHLVGLARLPALCDALRPDVIHVQWLPLPLLDRRWLPALRRRAPLVLTVHNAVPFHGSASRLQRLAAQADYDLFDGVIVHTPSTRHHLVGQGVDPGRIAILPHGLLPLAPASTPAPGLAPTPAGGAGDAPCRILFFGEIKPYKGLAPLIEALAALSPERRARLSLHVAGRPRMEMAPLRARAAAAGLAVTWDLRYVPDAEVTGLFAAADLVALPYADVDMSGVLALAMTAGKAVLASDLGGFRDLLVHERTALLARPEPPALAAALARLVDDPALRARLGAALRDHGAIDVPSWREIARGTLAAYGKARSVWRADPLARPLAGQPRGAA